MFGPPGRAGERTMRAGAGSNLQVVPGVPGAIGPPQRESRGSALGRAFPTKTAARVSPFCPRSHGPSPGSRPATPRRSPPPSGRWRGAGHPVPSGSGRPRAHAAGTFPLDMVGQRSSSSAKGMNTSPSPVKTQMVSARPRPTDTSLQPSIRDPSASARHTRSPSWTIKRETRRLDRCACREKLAESVGRALSAELWVRWRDVGISVLSVSTTRSGDGPG